MDTRVSCRLDWLTITGKGSLNEVSGGHLDSVTAEWYAKDRLSYLLQDFQALEQKRGNGFYPYVFEDMVTHCTLEVSDRLDVQGWKFVMPGSAVLTDEQRQHVLQRAVDAKLKVTRIDVAVDIVNSGISPEFIHRQWDNEAHVGKSLSSDFKKRSTGDTFYLGSRYSAYFLRAYDKGKQQGLGDDWLRCEIELKEHAASYYAELCAFDPAVAVREIRRMVGLPGSKLDVILGTVQDKVVRERPKTPRIKPDPVVWFNTTVMAAFRELTASHRKEAELIVQGMSDYLLSGFAVIEEANSGVPFDQLRTNPDGILLAALKALDLGEDLNEDA